MSQRKFLPKGETDVSAPTVKNPWAIRFMDSQKREDSAKVRLIAFHYAGGSASAFRLWDKELGSNVSLVAVELPGHAGRYSEPILTNVREIAEQAAQHLLPYLDRPFFVFGHSAGSMIAFETTKIWSRPPYNLAPRCFFASGDPAPHFTRLQQHEVPSHKIADDDTFDRLITDRYKDPTLAQMKKEYPDLLAALRKCLRADMTAYETYKLADDARLPCPIRTFAGMNDTRIVEFYEYLDEWQQYSDTPCTDEPTLLPGGHFYFNSDAKPIVSAILKQIRSFSEL